MGIYKALRPALFSLSPEAAHGCALLGLRAARPLLPLLSPWLRFDGPGAFVDVCGLRFPGRVGLAAGMDKAVEALDCWQHLGFSHVEVGTLTRHAQPGNPRPRVFRFPASQALINRFGFNNPGADEAAARLSRYRDRGRWPKHPVGVNLGKSKITPLDEAESDYLYSLERLAPLADYVAVNVSSPNTPGLRSLQVPRSIKRLATVLKKALKKAAKPGIAAEPFFVKLAPDWDAKALLASGDAALSGGADGLILTNTTLSREGLDQETSEAGGLSGAPLLSKANACLGAMARHTRGRVPLIGVGGIFSPVQARQKLDLGAVLVQVYTGFIYEGPGLARRIEKGLSKR